MKLWNKILLFIGLLILLDIVVSCGFNVGQKNIYNNNKKIAQQGDSHTYNRRTGNENSNDKIDWKYSGFSGDDTIWILKPKEDGEITINYDSTVNNGNFKVVLTNPKKQEIKTILEGIEEGSETIKLLKEEYRIKIVGKNAEGNIKLSINENKNVEITNKY